MKAIVVTDRAEGTAGMKLVERPEPSGSDKRRHRSGSCVGIRRDRVRRGPRPGPIASTVTGHRSIPGHELAGVVTALGYGTTGLSIGQRVFGLADWHRDGTLAEYVAVEARNLAPLPDDVDFTVGASLPISGLTAWQGLFEHGRLQRGTERPCARRGRRGRVDGDATRTRVRRLRDRHRTRRRPSEGARLRRARVRRPRQRGTGGCRPSRSGVRSHRRRYREAVRAPGSTRRKFGAQSSGRPRRGLPTAWRSTSLSRPIAPNWVRSSSECGTDDC